MCSLKSSTWIQVRYRDRNVPEHLCSTVGPKLALFTPVFTIEFLLKLVSEPDSSLDQGFLEAQVKT